MTATGAPLAQPGSSPAEIAELLALAEHAARAGGALVAGRRPARPEVAATKSSPTDVVTEMDRACEHLLRDLLAAERPGDALFGEEGGAGDPAATVAEASGLTWVLDPIDGTVNYLYGMPIYAVSVAVVSGDVSVPGAWQPLAGCVHNPATGETFTAARGAGAWLDGVRLPSVLAPQPLEQALIGTGFGYRAQVRREQAELLVGLLPRVRDIRRTGSAALDLCAVAAGRLDAYYERGVNAWDIAAGMLVLTETGGRLLGPDGGPPTVELTVAGRDPLLDELVAALEDARSRP